MPNRRSSAKCSRSLNVRLPRDGLKMADIFIRCPVTSQTILTGLNTEMVVFKTLPNVEIPLKCPHCGQTHRWTPEDAWLTQSGTPTSH